MLNSFQVPSFLSDTESMEEFPKRAYSVGSKPVPLRPVLNESYSYMDMTNSNQSLDKGMYNKLIFKISTITVSVLAIFVIMEGLKDNIQLQNYKFYSRFS